MRNHEVIAAWIHVVVSVSLCAAIILLWVSAVQLGSIFRWSLFQGIVEMFGKPFAIALIVIALIDLAGAVGLLRQQRWARPVLIGISVIELPIFPFGTALGAYTLWTLTSGSRATVMGRPLL